jgi:hypothetical protein
MVWTWSWKNGTIGYASSKDLVNWTPHSQLPVMADEPKAVNTWAPAIYWEPAQKRWLIFWSSTIPGRFPGDDQGDGGLNHRIWSTTTADFKKLTPAKVFFDPGYSVIDATLLPTPEIAGAPFHLIFKDERKNPLEKHLLTASGPTLEVDACERAVLGDLVGGCGGDSRAGRIPGVLRPLHQTAALRGEVHYRLEDVDGCGREDRVSRRVEARLVPEDFAGRVRPAGGVAIIRRFETQARLIQTFGSPR